MYTDRTQIDRDEDVVSTFKESVQVQLRVLLFLSKWLNHFIDS